MKEEFKTLSDTLYEGKWCHITHLKEFIKRLKENSAEVHDCLEKDCKCYDEKAEESNCWLIRKKKLDKLAGEKLI